jgi:chorismate mutase
MNEGSISNRVKDFQYAVRGAISIRASEIEREMEAGKKYPFKKIIQMNIGNP